MCEGADVCEAALCWGVGRGGGRFPGFHFEAKMDACAHFFLMPLWPYLASYITHQPTDEHWREPALLK